MVGTDRPMTLEDFQRAVDCMMDMPVCAKCNGARCFVFKIQMQELHPDGVVMYGNRCRHCGVETWDKGIVPVPASERHRYKPWRHTGLTDGPFPVQIKPDTPCP